jgi:hypothetical protein
VVFDARGESSDGSRRDLGRSTKQLRRRSENLLRRMNKFDGGPRVFDGRRESADGSRKDLGRWMKQFRRRSENLARQSDNFDG